MDLMTAGMYFNKKKLISIGLIEYVILFNKSGPRLKPWGTPHLITQIYICQQVQSWFGDVSIEGGLFSSKSLKFLVGHSPEIINLLRSYVLRITFYLMSVGKYSL